VGPVIVTAVTSILVLHFAILARISYPAVIPAVLLSCALHASLGLSFNPQEYVNVHQALWYQVHALILPVVLTWYNTVAQYSVLPAMPHSISNPLQPICANACQDII
jgi:hypothetical protein